MSKLTILRGVSGSGKSTYAEAVPGAMVVSRDRLRLALFGSDDQDYYNVPKEVLSAKEDAVTVAEHSAIQAGLRRGFHVISDNTNVRMEYVKKTAMIAYAEGAEVELKVIDVPLKVAVQRNAQRKLYGGREVPESVIRQQYDSLQQSKNATVAAPEALRKYTGTPGKPAAFMYDLDGTVYHHEGKRSPYALNVEVDDVDPVIPLVIASFTDNQLSNTMFAIAMSGRKEGARAATEFSLKRDGIWYDDLFMRADDDNRKDSLVKYDLFWENVAPNYDVKFVLDDRQQVVDMWRSIGIKCLQVAPGDF